GRVHPPAPLLRVAALVHAREQDPAAVRGHVVQPTLPTRAQNRRLVLSSEQRARCSEPDFGPELRGHGVHGVALPEEQLATDSPPARLGAAARGDAPARASLPQLPYVDL